MKTKEEENKEEAAKVNVKEKERSLVPGTSLQLCL